jgi:Amt family ammonium transporter
MVTRVKLQFGYDDSLDVFGIHGAGGTLGVLLTGVFATNAVNKNFRDPSGRLLPIGLIDGNAGQVINQLVGCGVAWAVTLVGTFLVLKLCDMVIGLRVERETEIIGLDLATHGEEAYQQD